MNNNTVEDCISFICMFAKKVISNKEMNPSEIFYETNYMTFNSEISSEDIAANISINLSIVDEWIFYSEDKRYIPAWYFVQKSKGKWIVGYLNSDGQENKQQEFDSSINGCAYFIKMEMEHFNNINKGGS